MGRSSGAFRWWGTRISSNIVGWQQLVLGLAAIMYASGCRPAPPPSAAPTTSNTTPDLTPELIASHNRAVAQMGHFDYAAAWETLTPLAETYRHWNDLQVDWAIATLNRRQEGDSEQAIKRLQQVVDRQPKHWRAKYCLAILKLDGGDPEGALLDFREVADADPGDAYAQYYTGQCLSQVGQIEASLGRFEQAIASDPYLRSAYYGAFQACLRLGQSEKATEYRTAFERLEDNPQSRLAEIKYTRMGPKATLSALVAATAPRPSRPSGAIFAASQPLTDMQGRAIPWRTVGNQETAPTITIAETRARGPFLACLTNATTESDHPNVVLQAVDDRWEWWPNHPLSTITEVTAVAWGDYDNDGLADFYVGRRHANQLWHQLPDDRWEDVTAATGMISERGVTHDAQWVDADHDGDLDLLVVGEGANELWNNNGNGTFRALAQEQAIVGSSSNATRSVVADLDRDRDLDLLVVRETPPHDGFLNDRLWSYRPAASLQALLDKPASALLPLDRDVDGQPEIWQVHDGQITIWARHTDGTWHDQPWQPAGLQGHKITGPLGTADCDGDGRLDALVPTDKGWCLLDIDSGQLLQQDTTALHAWRLVHQRHDQGPALLAWTGAGPQWYAPGPGRFHFLQVRFTGKEEKADQMRSNRDGTGVIAAARLGATWIGLSTLRHDASAGQNLQPLSVGLRDQQQLDFLSLTWPDGVFQTEYDLARDQRHDVTETQRQVSSCPVIFTWNGHEYTFVTDALGVAGIGYNLGRGTYGEPRPWEHLLLPANQLAMRDGRYAIKITEPMEEVCYLDAARLVRYDLPAGWSMALDERCAVNGPQPTGAPVFYRDVTLPIAATDSRGVSVLEQLTTADLVAAEPGKIDRRFVGRTERQAFELTFDQEITGANLFLLMDGWIEYPYSQTMFAAWQAGATYDAPTLEAQSPDGEWHVVAEQFGYPAGMPRQALLPLDATRLPPGTRRLRISTTMEIYWDRLAIVRGESPPQWQRVALPLAQARVGATGFAQRTLHPQRRPEYDYQRRLPLWDTRHLRGEYSLLGPVEAMVRTTDDAVAIIGPGEEIDLEFANDSAREPESTTISSHYVLELDGWCKDMDLYTRDGDTVGPLPQRDPSRSSPERDALHRANHRRYQSGY